MIVSVIKTVIVSLGSLAFVVFPVDYKNVSADIILGHSLQQVANSDGCYSYGTWDYKYTVYPMRYFATLLQEKGNIRRL